METRARRARTEDDMTRMVIEPADPADLLHYGYASSNNRPADRRYECKPDNPRARPSKHPARPAPLLSERPHTGPLSIEANRTPALPAQASPQHLRQQLSRPRPCARTDPYRRPRSEPACPRYARQVRSRPSRRISMVDYHRDRVVWTRERLCLTGECGELSPWGW